MAYRRKQGVSSKASSTFEDFRSATTEPPSLAAQAIRASAAHRDSSLSSAYGESAIASSAARRDSNRERSSTSPRDSSAYEYTSMKNLNESKYGFWGGLARKAKAILEDDNMTKQETPGREQPQAANRTTGSQFYHSNQSPRGYRNTETPPLQKSSDTIASSLNYIGGTIKNALEEGLSIVENKTADIIHETRKLHIGRKGNDHNAESPTAEKSVQHPFPQRQADYETQLKASRDVANAMAAKAKLLLRELKTVKADLAFAKERCAQLEEENKMLRESHEKGSDPEDDDLVRLQLETLLAEKARLAQENSIYARENRFLREIVEYHQLTMQDVIYVDEGIEEVKEVYSIQIPSGSLAPAVSEAPSPLFPTNPPPNHIPRSTAAAQPPPAASPSVLVSEACPVVPMPPTRPPQAARPNTKG